LCYIKTEAMNSYGRVSRSVPKHQKRRIFGLRVRYCSLFRKYYLSFGLRFFFCRTARNCTPVYCCSGGGCTWGLQTKAGQSLSPSLGVPNLLPSSCFTNLLNPLHTPQKKDSSISQRKFRHHDLRRIGSTCHQHHSDTCRTLCPTNHFSLDAYNPRHYSHDHS